MKQQFEKQSDEKFCFPLQINNELWIFLALMKVSQKVVSSLLPSGFAQMKFAIQETTICTGDDANLTTRADVHRLKNSEIHLENNNHMLEM